MSEFRFKDKFKTRISSKYSQEQKRNEYLRRQKEKRRDLSMQLRVLCHDVLPSASKSKRYRKNARKSARPHMVMQQLCEPEWMTEVPHDMIVQRDDGALQCEWFVVARPEGRRCVVISSKGSTFSYLENGRVLHQFKSFLPGGGLSPQGASSAILDCIYYEPLKIYYILDIMSWNDMHTYECTAEFRFYWLRAKVDETPFITPQFASPQQHSFAAVPYWECSLEGLREAYTAPMPYSKNGLLFYHREGHYEVGLTPLVLLWKDSSVTAYLDDQGEETIALRFVDDAHSVITEDGAGVTPGGMDDAEGAAAVSEVSLGSVLSSSAMLCSLESVPLVPLSDVWPSQIAAMEQREGGEGGGLVSQLPSLRCGGVVRGAIREAGYDNSTGAPFVRGFELHKVCSDKKVGGDSWSKIYFKHLLRTAPITIHDIAAAMETPGTAHVDNACDDGDVHTISCSSCHGGADDMVL